MSERIKILTPRIYEHSDFFHDAVDFARENSLNTNELCLELSHYLVDNFNKVWKIEKPRIYKKITDLEAKLEELRKQITICNEENSKTFMKFVDVCRQNAELKQQLEESEKRLKDIDNWKENYGYSNYEDVYMLEDLQSRAFQSEDDTEVVNELLDYLNISDETEILSTLKQQLAESEIKLNRYPYKNDVIEEEYEDLKDAITFLMLNNIKDQEQLNYSIDVLCEKHKARIRDIENSICKIEQLEQQLAEKEKEKDYYQDLYFIAVKKQERTNKVVEQFQQRVKYFSEQDQDKISFCIEKLEKVKDELTKLEQNYNLNLCDVKIYNFIDNQIKQLKEGK